ncbi:unnamed protein product [Clonostachys rosea f. rosea IK726]|jgi:hypothetical protein|uniref:Uncharacterized protein n=1 Tax=Clonostachys rosea f. rosea IK726 TaxID=1349383 RepID=A0ACA9TS93_BIOOC|nr:unnamed protein product [Clonostachys rosea f. rosea IK726]
MKTYIPIPNFSTPPPADGPLDLGHILHDLTYSSIAAPLNKEGHVAIPDRLQPDKKEGFNLSRKELLSGEFGIFAKFLAMFGVGAEAPSSYRKSADDILTVDALETITFSPQREYIEKSMSDHRVKSRMMACQYREPVFMVTGMKMARGASLQSNLHEVDGKSPFGFCSPQGAWGVDIPFVGSGDAGNHAGKSLDSSTDFILALRLKKIFYREGKMLTKEYHKVATIMDHITGEMYSAELESSDDDVGLQDVPFGKDMVLAGGNTHDEDELCYLAFPKGV